MGASSKIIFTLSAFLLLPATTLFSQDTVVPKPSYAAMSSIAVQITHSRFYDPTLSPDGKQMIYISLVADKEQLFISRVDTKSARQITVDDANHEDPAWSPDGLQLAFVLIKDSIEVLELLNLKTGDRKMITPTSMRVIHPSWSADGKQVLFCTDDDLRPPYKNSSEIYSLDIATNKIKALISGGTNTFPVLSPDGKTIAFRKMLDGLNSEVFAADADGTNIRNLTNHPAFDGWPSWSPDGKRIAFASNRNANYQVFVMDKNGKNVFLAANTEGRATAPTWAPDGHTIYFTNCKKVDFGTDCHIYHVDLNNVIAH